MVATYSEPFLEQLCATACLAELLSEPPTLPNRSRDFSQLTGQHGHSRRVGKTIPNPEVSSILSQSCWLQLRWEKCFLEFRPANFTTCWHINNYSQNFVRDAP